MNLGEQIAALFSVIALLNAASASWSADDFDKTTDQMIADSGYPVEKHTVTTQDGYILTLHRITGRQNTTLQINSARRRPVLLQHGLLSSSVCWIFQPPQRSLAYMLADQGYDVWLGNARGNIYSRRHESMTPDQRRFWQFSWDEMGKYDLPATIDHILAQTQQRKLFFVGHSMGTTMFWALMHHHPEYNRKIRRMYALSPVAKVTHSAGATRYLVPIANGIGEVAEWFGTYSVLLGNGWLKYIVKYLCSAGETHYNNACDQLMALVEATDQQVNRTALPVILGHTFAGVSIMTLVHYGQNAARDSFRQYDWGVLENLQRYGREKPPSYKLRRVRCAVILYTADNDDITDRRDLAWLENRLKNVQYRYRVPLRTFSHVDFVIAKDADKLLYWHIISDMNKQ